MDTGDILLFERTPIGAQETAGELYERLAAIGARVLMRTLDQLAAGTLVRTPQGRGRGHPLPHAQKGGTGKLDFSQPAQRVHDRVRGVNPWPGAYAAIDGGETLKIWKTRLTGAQGAALPPGACVGDAREGLFVKCADELLELLEVQAPGGRRLDGRAFLRGRPLAGRVLS